MDEPTANRLYQSLRRFSGILSESEIHQIMAIQEGPLPTGIRLNPLKTNPQAAIQELSSRYGWQINPLSFCEHAWTIDLAAYPPGKTIEHRLGYYYLQDAASMVPVSLFDIHKTQPLILDMAASPGGKTTHLIDRTRDRGLILANDTSRARIPALRSVLTTWGGLNTMVTNFPGESFGGWFPETFDLILLDAPCSMENLRPTPNHPLRETTATERERLQDRQIQLLISGVQALKVGGQIVYATCSLAPEEDEAVIDRVFQAYPDALMIEDVSEKVPFSAPGLAAFDENTFEPTLVHALRLWPHLTGMSGFFSARLKKIDAIQGTPKQPPKREFSRTQLNPATHDQQEQVISEIALNYGINLREILEAFNVELFFRLEGVFLIPKAYLTNFHTLPFEYIGMALGLWVAGKLQPSHEFFSRFGHQFTTGKVHIDDDQVDQWIAGRDIRYPDITLTPQGQYLLVVDQDGRNLGMGKLLPKRLRNMLPKSSI